MNLLDQKKSYCINYKGLSHTSKNAYKKLKKHSFCIIKRIIKKEQIKLIQKLFNSRFHSISEKRVSGPWRYKMRDFKRLDLGDSYKNSRFSRCITFCEWNKNNDKFYSIINPIINLRNSLSKVEKEKYTYKNLVPFQKKNSNKKIFCDFVRMLQYPTGGGFLEKHDDFDKHYPEQIINAILVVTSRQKKGKKVFDAYQKGGLYFIKNSKKINVENLMEAGDLVVFDQKIPHGVNSIDPDKNISLNKLNGRISLAFSIGSFLR